MKVEYGGIVAIFTTRHNPAMFLSAAGSNEPQRPY